MIVKARIVVTMDGPPIEHGAIVIDDDHIVAVGRYEEMRALDAGPIVDLGERVVLPGLINAHCHLDYSMLRNSISPPASFTAWVKRLNALKRELHDDEYLAAIQRGFEELKRWGTTTVCNIEAFPELMARMPETPIRTWWFYEMIDIRHRVTSEDVVAGALTFFQHGGAKFGGFGLSPHAPYTASRQLYQLANECAATMEMPRTTHVAESREELAMFRDAAGPLHEFLSSLNRPMGDCGNATPFQILWRSGAIDRNWILAHMNELDETDFALLAEAAPNGGPHVVHCPGSHRYFGHSPFPFRRLHEMGLNICVGTDSLASTDSLSLLRELRRVRENEPWLSTEQLLRTITINPARALGRGGQIGRIAANALADLIALPTAGLVEHVHEEILTEERPISWMMIDGQIVS